ncbi:ABC transporter permease [Micromonospora sp. KLBMP9576]|uniref:ABC transporter permease n=1 Tax=Micromonospora sp. KLBMP9576 TaxID=3424769 RepID=UPI003D904B3E
MRPRVLGALAVADFRERVRRPGYLVVLLAAVGLGYLAAPAAGAHWTIVNAGMHRGVYNSAYVGTVTALAGALWLSLGGFYVVRTAIARDERSGVGQLLAATPLRMSGYLVGKFLSNLLVLGSMAVALAGTAVVMQLARGESYAVDPVAILLPFALYTVPVLAVTATAAVLFETLPVLRGGFGNVVWFFVAMFAVLAGQSPDAPLGGLGVHVFAESLRDAFAAQGITLTEIALGLMYLDVAPRAVVWTGVDFTAGFVGDRILLVVLATAVAVLPALWFGRFDPARSVRSAGPAPVVPVATAPTTALPDRPVLPSPQTMPRRGRAFGRLLVGELRILTQGVPWWWWLGAAALIAVGAAVPASASGTTLIVTSIWPVLIWSRLGTQSHEFGVEALLGACPAPVRRALTQWLAGVALTVLVGLAPGVRMAIAGDLADWLAGAAFVPALALALGVLTRTARLFQVGYLLLWYAVLNGVAGLDYLGALDGGPSPVLVGAATALLLAAALCVVAARHARR